MKQVEKHFDEVMSGKERLEYTFDMNSMGIKDRRIAETLLDYSIGRKKCLDIGPGTGRWLTFLKQKDADWLGGVDISGEVLERCRDLCDKTQKADLEHDSLDFQDDFFDIIISIEVLEHLRQPENYISEIIRTAKPGALVLLTIPNIASFISRLRLLMGLLPVAIAADPTHVGFYRQKDLRNLFAHFGQKLQFLPSSFSLNPVNPKSRFRVPSSAALSSFDDSLVFKFIVKK